MNFIHFPDRFDSIQMQELVLLLPRLKEIWWNPKVPPRPRIPSLYNTTSVTEGTGPHFRPASTDGICNICDAMASGYWRTNGKEESELFMAINNEERTRNLVGCQPTPQWAEGTKRQRW